MTENYIHYVWKYKLFETYNCQVVSGESIEFIDFGFHNRDAGPDFSQATIKIGNTVWVGNIEIHVNSSDWMKHKHHHNRAYDTVVLHVVYNYDREIRTTSGSVIPTLELKDLLDYSNYEEYERFIFQPIPCINLLQDVPEIVVSSTLDQMLVDRLISKTTTLKSQLEESNYDWEYIFFVQLAKSIGLNINSAPMEELTKSLGYKIINKLGANRLAIESLLFGQSGFLSSENDNGDYFNALKKEFAFQKMKHDLIPLKKECWKFSKLRPQNFPTVRLAQFAQLLLRNESLFSSFIHKEITIELIREQLDCTVKEGFWYSHYTFDKESKPIKKSMGNQLIDSIIINTIVPFLYQYGAYKDELEYREKAIELLEKLRPENNRIIRLFKDKISLNSSAQTQGLIHCHNNYCINKKCLECGIGVHLLKR